MRPFAPVETALGGQDGEGAEAAHQVLLGGQVGEGAEAAHQVWLGGSLTPVQITLGRGRMQIIINWYLHWLQENIFCSIKDISM